MPKAITPPLEEHVQLQELTAGEVAGIFRKSSVGDSRRGTVMILDSGLLLVTGQRGEQAVHSGDQIVYSKTGVTTRLAEINDPCGRLQLIVSGNGVTEITPPTSRLALHQMVAVQPPEVTAWNSSKNNRRCDLIDKQIAGTLSPTESRELENLQSQMLQFRRRVAPLPLTEARELHRQLQSQAGMLDE